MLFQVDGGRLIASESAVLLVRRGRGPGQMDQNPSGFYVNASALSDCSFTDLVAGGAEAYGFYFAGFDGWCPPVFSNAEKKGVDIPGSGMTAYAGRVGLYFGVGVTVTESARAHSYSFS